MGLIEKFYHKVVHRIDEWKDNEFKRKLGGCGRNVTVLQPCRFEGMGQIFIGNDVSIAPFVHIWGNGGLIIGDNTLIASHVAITTLTHDKHVLPYNEGLISKKIFIGKNVWIGSHAIILPGVTIGDNAIIGAGALVNRDVFSGELVMGLPIKKVYNDE